MFVINVKMNYKKILLLCIIVATIIASIVEFGMNDNSIFTNSNIDNIDYQLNDENFVETLEKIHNSLDENIGKTVSVKGFVYILPDFNDNIFVCGRYLTTDSETQVAGFLCQKDEAASIVENEWVEVTGTIIKGEYNGDVPVIRINKINKIIAPANTYVEK